MKTGNFSRDGWDEALAALTILDACYRSNAEGRTVEIAPGARRSARGAQRTDEGAGSSA